MGDTEENKGPVYISETIFKLSATSSTYPPKGKETGINN